MTCNFNLKAKGRKKDIDVLMALFDTEYFKGVYPEVAPIEEYYEETSEIKDSSLAVVYEIYGSCYSDIKKDLIEDEKNIVELSRQLGLIVEIISDDADYNFTEHYLIDNGKILMEKDEPLFTDKEREMYLNEERNITYFNKVQEIYDKFSI